jgi:pyridoxamine 5'-phosphate oxidase
VKKEEIIAFINANLACHLATVEGDQPHVRGMMAYRADENGVLFHTGRAKDLYRHIAANPRVEISFLNRETNTQVRVKGKAVIKNDDALKQEIVAARPFLKPWVEKAGLEALVVFQVVDCTACIWTFATNFAPKEYIKITA